MLITILGYPLHDVLLCGGGGGGVVVWRLNHQIYMKVKDSLQILFLALDSLVNLSDAFSSDGRYE